MYHEIKFRGQASNPSNYDAHDGELALSLNIILEDEALRPIPKPAVLHRGLSVVYIHETETYRNYIVLGNDHLYSVQEQDLDKEGIPVVDFATFSQITHIGNTLLILNDEGMHYCLFQQGRYKYLGTDIPYLPLQVGLRKTPIQGGLLSTYLTLQVDGVYHSRGGHSGDDIAQNAKLYSKTMESLFSVLNPLIREIQQNEKFSQPFFVRYALRLYDGTLTKHSAPILMMPTNGYPIFFSPGKIYGSDVDTGYRTRTFASVIDACDITISLLRDDLSRLEGWSDIIRSVDIFVSAPIYTYTQDPQLSDKEKESYNLFFKSDDNPQGRVGIYGGLASADYSRVDPPIAGSGIYINIPSPSFQDLNKRVKETSTFYLVSSISLEGLKDYTAPTSISIKDGTLLALETQEVMTDDYNTHERIIPQRAFVYNARLNLASISRKLFSGFAPALTSPYTNKGDRIKVVKAFVHISDFGREYIVESPSSNYNLDTAFYYFFPNPNATKLTLATNDGQYYAVTLERHAFLNGAVAFVSLHQTFIERASRPTASPTTTQDLRIPIHNKIYTSEINNPFLFPSRGINTIGTGSILGLSSATKAISEGQYGQFPLYAFTTEGVWALSVSSDGTYSAKHPTTRDVCINPRSITQLDNAVLFASERGVMLLSGSEAMPITDALLGRSFDIDTLPFADDIIEISGLPHRAVRIPDFRSMLNRLEMIYDYRHQRVIIFEPALREDYASPAFVYSLRSRTWAMMDVAIAKAIPSYPEALAVSSVGDLLDFSRGAIDEDGQYVLVVSRPFDFGARDIYKTIRQLFPRGFYPNGAVGSVLYGTSDYHTWDLIASSQDGTIEAISGSPYKAFRLVLTARLREQDAISLVSVQYLPRFSGKIQH